MTTPTPSRAIAAIDKTFKEQTGVVGEVKELTAAIVQLERDLAAAQDRAERTEVWAHGLEADMDKLREELAAAQSENAKLKAEITRVMQAAANGGYCRRNHAKCECENIAESIRTDE